MQETECNESSADNACNVIVVQSQSVNPRLAQA